MKNISDLIDELTDEQFEDLMCDNERILNRFMRFSKDEFKLCIDREIYLLETIKHDINRRQYELKLVKES